MGLTLIDADNRLLMTLLDPTQTRDLLASLSQWRLETEAGGAITRQFRFVDFAQAFAFMSKVATLAERHDHHPDWSNAYNQVSIRLTTHDAGGLTLRDIELARLIDQALIDLTQSKPAQAGSDTDIDPIPLRP